MCSFHVNVFAIFLLLLLLFVCVYYWDFALVYFFYLHFFFTHFSIVNERIFVLVRLVNAIVCFLIYYDATGVAKEKNQIFFSRNMAGAFWYRHEEVAFHYYKILKWNRQHTHKERLFVIA